MKIIFFDTETTGIESKGLIQLAYTIYNIYDENFELIKEFNKKIKTDIKIEIGAMAVHHLTEKDILENGIDFEQVREEVQKDFDNAIIVAHNVEYDYEVLEQSGIDLSNAKQIDTYKIAYYLDETAERYSLQYLRYFYEIYEARSKITAHDAMSDVIILEEVFKKLVIINQNKKINSLDINSINQELNIKTSNLENNLENNIIINNQEIELKNIFKIDPEIINEFIEITSKPLLLRDWKFGKYRGELFEKVASEDIGYLEWAYNKLVKPKVESGEDYDKNLKYTLEKYLNLLN